ncbi:unnamed protein product [Owenia fusiformis]|uniref:Lipase domain-containing protein n=1 Tax=Owenia fusiformis TaxID=6347 RepID=A0A8S4Q5A0_OWEFU|nr:unnamed protein product [Owenia fusiformis]
MLSVVVLGVCFALSNGFLLSPEDGQKVADIRLHHRRNGKDSLGDYKGVQIKVNDVSTLRKSNFDPRLPTKFFVHGWLGSQDNWYILEMTEAFLKKGNMNVFVVDWQRGSNNLDYTLARERTKTVGKEIADYVKFLARHTSLNMKNVHLVGHSLGGQTVGYAGMHLKNPKVGRISSLDPAEFLFNLNNKDDTIDRTDADFVDVIHTSWVSIKPKGHVDFYPNDNDVGHMMAVYYFTDSINNRCKNTAVQCRNWKTFATGNCKNNRSNEMGYYASPRRALGKVFIKMNDSKRPYCPGQ